MSRPATDRDNEGPSLEGPPLLAGMSALADSFDGYILDLWGVLHDGVQAFPHALDCLGRLRAVPVCGLRTKEWLFVEGGCQEGFAQGQGVASPA